MKVVVDSAEVTVRVSSRQTRRVAHSDNLMVVVWDFTNGPDREPDPFHAHPHEQVTCVVGGEVLFFIGEESRRLQPGDMVVVPPGRPHTIQVLTPEVRLIDAFTPLREEFLQAGSRTGGG
ncbi:MAG: cupin domain-containing protein [bacterium]|nr:MAG: cupin domain-containing protein [bacterium]